MLSSPKYRATSSYRSEYAAGRSRLASTRTCKRIGEDFGYYPCDLIGTGMSSRVYKGTHLRTSTISKPIRTTRFCQGDQQVSAQGQQTGVAREELDSATCQGWPPKCSKARVGSRDWRGRVHRNWILRGGRFRSSHQKANKAWWGNSNGYPERHYQWLPAHLWTRHYPQRSETSKCVSVWREGKNCRFRVRYNAKVPCLNKLEILKRRNWT